ncbi:MAG: non-hydrolyzing UDP-N-acetylglucosamine 2-epimerase [Flavobacteriales bacterium]|jgi:UDP-GlcNAc3NAcA epimerase
MTTILTIVGTRPQIIKAAALSRAFAACDSGRVEEILVHTGQHYDDNMSQVFFDELEMPAPRYQLNAGSGGHLSQLAAMLEGLERIIDEVRPNAILVYGDTNSTLAGALAASKRRIPLIHVEAGLRSFNKAMPEENNRIVTDHASSLLFVPTEAALNNLAKEGLDITYRGTPSADHPLIVATGDVMYDNALHFGAFPVSANVLPEEVKQSGFILATVHRDNNTDDEQRLKAILKGLNNLAVQTALSVVLPVHPRLKRQLRTFQIEMIDYPSIHLIEPVSYRSMLALLKACSLVCTDSGGLQKEAYFMERPCVIMRPETEWVELLTGGHARIADADSVKIVDAGWEFIQQTPADWPSLYGDGQAAKHMCDVILTHF